MSKSKIIPHGSSNIINEEKSWGETSKVSMKLRASIKSSDSLYNQKTEKENSPVNLEDDKDEGSSVKTNSLTKLEVLTNIKVKINNHSKIFSFNLKFNRSIFRKWWPIRRK